LTQAHQEGSRMTSAPFSIAALTTKRFGLACLGILALALVFRLPGLTRESLWLDEAYSALFSAKPLVELWSDVPSYETHPPFYYTLLKGWTGVFGQSEAGLRSLSLAADLLTIALVACAARLLHLPRSADGVALTAAVLLAVHGDMVNRAADARPYALMTLAVTFAMLAGLRLLIRLRDGQERLPQALPDILALSVAGGLILWLHNTGFFICLGLWCGLGAGVLWTRPQHLFAVIAAVVASGFGALLIWSPGLPIFFEQSRAMAAMAFWTQPKLGDAFSVWPMIAGGGFAVPAVLVGLALGFRRLAAISRPITAFAAITLFLPLALMLGVHFVVKPVFIDRLFAWMAPGCLVIAVIGLKDLSARSRGLALAAVVMIAAGSLMTVIGGKPVKEPWRDIVAMIARESKAEDVILAAPNEVLAPLSYYASGAKAFPRIVYAPGPFPLRDATRRYVTNLGAPVIEAKDAPALQKAIDGAERVWLIERKAELFDPGGVVRQVVSEGRGAAFSAQDGDILVELHIRNR
jgi:hypothetical protein